MKGKEIQKHSVCVDLLYVTVGLTVTSFLLLRYSQLGVSK